MLVGLIQQGCSQSLVDEYRHYTVGFRVIMLITGTVLAWLRNWLTGYLRSSDASAICIAFIAAKLFNVSFALGIFAAGHARIALQSS
jgi:predicted Kef-type K+ transport protein